MVSAENSAPSAPPSQVPAPRKNRLLPTIAVVVVVLAAIAAGGAWYLNRAPDVETVMSELSDAGAELDPASTVTLLAEAAPQLDREDMTRIAEHLSSQSPEIVRHVADTLIRQHTEANARTLGALIAERGAEKHKTAGLLNRAGLEYYLGRFVERDYAKATRFLADPALSSVPISQYYLGEVLVATDNPDRDHDKGLSLLRASSAAGIEAATKRLAELEGGAS